MKKVLILVLSFAFLALAINKAEAKWWIFGESGNEVGFNYLYINNTSYDELGSKAVLYKDSLQNGVITIKGKTNIKKGKVGYVKISKDNKQTWQNAQISEGGVFSYSFAPEVGHKYQLCIEASDTMGIINNVDETYKEITISDENINSAVRETVNSMIRAYENEEENLFMTFVSPEFTGDEVVLDSAIRKDFNAFDSIKINTYINNITSSSNGRVYVALQYNRNLIAAKTGQIYSDKGFTEFVLSNENGKFKIFSMKNPLIFGLSNAGEVATGTVQSTNNDPIIIVDSQGNVDEKPFKTAIDIINDNAEISSSESSNTVEVISATIPLNMSLDFATEATGMSMHYDLTFDFVDVGGTPTPYAWGYHGMGNHNDLGACSLSSLSSVPAYTDAGYSGGHFIPSFGHCYALLLGDPPYKYAVIKVGTLSPIHGMSIEYKYQPNGSTNM